MTTSRYDPTKTAQLIAPDGQTIVYLQRRLLPQPEVFAVLRMRTVEQDGSGRGASDEADSFGPEPKQPGTRLDVIAWEEFQDAEMYWLICDANGAVRPDDLEWVGTKLRIPLPEGIPGPSNE
jgi:hypothetical protein